VTVSAGDPTGVADSATPFYPDRQRAANPMCGAVG